jgi:DNA-binding transcriptional LysR family regulator
MLKVTAPNVIGHAVVVPVVAELIANNPALHVDLTLSDGVLDIAATGLDVAIRVAPIKPSDLVATRLADNPYTLCASPAYIARFGEPGTTGDLARHRCIKLHAMETWPFRRGGELDRIRVGGPLSASTVDAVRAACMAGVGVAMMTYWDVHEQLARKELKRLVLADAEPMELGIWAIFPTRRQMPVRVRAFIDLLRERLLAGTGRRDPS